VTVVLVEVGRAAPAPNFIFRSGNTPRFASLDVAFFGRVLFAIMPPEKDWKDKRAAPPGGGERYESRCMSQVLGNTISEQEKK
jgi:hypothetical protein